MEVGNIVDASAYYRISAEVPSGLDVDLPYTAIGNAPWVHGDGDGLGSTLGAPENLVAETDGAIVTYAFSDAQRHIVGLANHVSLGTFGIADNIPSNSGKIYFQDLIAGQSTRQINITWSSADEEADLTSYLTTGRELAIGSFSCEIAQSVTKNTVANGGFQFSCGSWLALRPVPAPGTCTPTR